MLILYIASIVVTQNLFLYNTMNTVFAPERRKLVKGDPSQYQYYTLDSGITDKETAMAYGNSVNEEITAQGFTLLKNEDSLPLARGARVSVFGQNSVNLVYGGSGSGGMDSSRAISVSDSLKSAGFEVNETLVNFYKNSGYKRPPSPPISATSYYLPGFATGEAPVSAYKSDVTSTFANYNDAALVVFSRVGGESFDLPRRMIDKNKNNEKIEGARNEDDHYLQLDQNESDLLELVCSNFDNVIIIINSSATLELGFLDDPEHYAYHEEIKGALWIGNPGGTGINSLGKVLNGTISPSGRTVDTYARDFKKDPTWQNFGDNLSDGGNTYIRDGKPMNTARFVEYEENIYVGYRYYETRAYEEKEKGNDDWWNENVIYPFGYGLSYADFDWELKSVKVNGEEVGDTEFELAADTKISIQVEVENVSDSYAIASRDVVELYSTAPYDPSDAPIEKPYVQLVDFAKSSAIAPGETTTVTLEVRAYELASYDYNDKNGNGHKGYELEAGDYKLKICANAHDCVISIPAKVSETINIERDSEAKGTSTIENRFDDVSEHFSEEGVQLMSRADFEGTFPVTPTVENRTKTKEFLDQMKATVTDEQGDPWYVAEMPKQSGKALSYNKTKVKLSDLIGKEYDDPLWDELLNELTVAQMSTLVGTGNFNTAAIPNIDKPRTIEPDGPGGYTNFMAMASNPPVYDTAFYASECVIGATWNTEMTYAMGVAVGNDSLIGFANGDGTTYSGWYAPAVNIHRSQFSGRNFEYYSEDGVLSGKMAAGVVSGAATKGVYTYVKHFALNDQEANRDTNGGLITWATEQAMREIYFKPFEYAVKEGGAKGMMSSFNRIGMTWAGASYALLTEILRNEWGFKGSVVTDYIIDNNFNIQQMLRAGGDIVLNQNKQPKDLYGNATHVAQLRRAAKNILYVTANSNAMNGFGPGVVYKYALPTWHVVLIIVVISVTVVVLGADGFMLWQASKMTDEQLEEKLAAKKAKKEAKKTKKADEA